MITAEQIGVKLAEAIKRDGRSQREIASLIGVSQQTVSHYLRGNIVPALDTFANLCAVLDVDPAEILCLK